MRRNVSMCLFTLLLLSLAGTAMAAVVGAGPGGPSTLPTLPSGVNIDVPFSTSSVCGFQIVVVGERPTNLYTGSRNPFPAPSITEVPVGSHNWVITWGPISPCISRDDPRFWSADGTTFLGLHFGFLTTDPIVHLISSGSVNATCWVLGPDGWVPGPRLTGHNSLGGFLNVLNANAQALAVGNAQIVVSPTEIPINGLTRSDLGQLNWQDVKLDKNIVPGGSNDAPGTLSIALPSLQGQKGWAVVTYSTADPATGEAQSTVTLEYPIQ
jgi:hypothetical protein